MQNHRFPLFLLCMFAVLGVGLAAAQEGPGALEVVGSYPLPGELLGDRFLVYFNQPISVADASTALQIEPDIIAGAISAGPNYLSFERDTSQPLPKNVYTFTVTPEAKSAAGQSLDPAKAVFTYATYRFDLQSIEYLNEDEQYLYFGVIFSSIVAPDALAKHLAVLDSAGQRVAWQVLSAENGTTQRISVPRSAPQPWKFALAAGMLDARGTVQLSAARQLTYPAEGSISVVSTELSAEEGASSVAVQFSSAIQAHLLQDKLKVTEALTGREIPFSIQDPQVQETVTLLLEGEIPEGTLNLHIEPPVPGQGLWVLSEAQDATLTQESEGARDQRPLEVDYSNWDERGVDGAVLRVRFNRKVNAAEMQKHLTVEPALANLRVEPDNWNYVAFYGDWQSEATYTLTVAADFAGGGDAAEPLEIVTDAVPKVEGADFQYPGKYYFPRKMAGPLPLQVRNLDKVDVTVHELFPSNIVAALEYLENGYTYEVFGEKYAQELDTREIPVASKPDQVVTVALNVEDILPQAKKGVFGLTVRPNDNYLSTRIVLWTDIGLLAHWQDNDVVVFAHNLWTLAPLSMAKVSVYSAKSQLMGTTNTDERGVAQLKALNTRLGEPKVVVVETDNDFTFLDLTARADDPTGFTESMPRFDSKAYDAFLYSDRNLYRPGETAHLRWVVRTGAGAPVSEVPLLLQVLNPKSSVVFSGPTTLSALGTGGTELATEKVWLTGKYTAELKVPGSEEAIQSYTFNVEEFVPNRMKAEVKVADTLWTPGEQQEFQVLAQHVFGAPASDRTAEANLILRKGDFKSDKWQGFDFGNDAEFKTKIVPLGEAKTDAAGVAKFTYPVEIANAITFPISAMVSGQVSELGGRAVRSVADVTILPAEVLVGLAAAAQEGGKVDVSVAAINADETPAALPTVKLTVERETWHYYVRRYQTFNEPNWSKTFETIQTIDVPLQEGRGMVTVDLPERYGYYRLRVSSDASKQYASQAFYAYYNHIEIVQQARPSLIKLVLNKERYEVGDEVQLRIESPFDGTAVVVQQGEGIQQVLTAPVKDGVGVVSFIASTESSPNVWLETTVVHTVPEDRAQVYPYSSFAMITAEIRDPKRNIQVSFPELPQEMRPEQEIQVKVQTNDSAGQPTAAEVTLALVDEGIHNILGYEKPEPYDFFQRLRQPDYRRTHYYDKVAYDFEPPATGGDLLARRLGKTSDVGDNWIKPLALWSGVINTDASGLATVKFFVPKFNGQVRLVAVAVSPTATGSGEAFMFVRQPYMLRTSVPRFTLPGDTFQAHANVFNTTDAPVSLKLTWAGTGTLTGGGSRELPVAAKSEASMTAEIAAGTATGQGMVEWTVDVLDASGKVLEQLKEQLPLPVLPPAVYQSDHALVVMPAGASQSFQSTRFRKSPPFEMNIAVTANPLLRLKKPLDYLIHYPYGCVEQTTSSSFPLYVLRKNAALLNTSMKDAARYKQYVSAGVRRLFSMQTPSGGLAMWPGGSSPYAYGSVYAGHFLTLVKREQEIPVPEQPFQKLMEYLKTVAQDDGRGAYYDLYQRAYALYVLALNGDTAALEQIPSFDTRVMPRSARYLLAAALAINTQDPERVKTYLASTPSDVFNDRTTHGTLNSGVRNTAVELMARLQMELPDEPLQEDVEQLIRYLDNDRIYTTQETAFVVTALGLYLDRFTSQPGAASGIIAGPDGEAKLAAGELVEKSSTAPEGVYTVTNNGQAPLFIDFTMAGIPEQMNVAPISEGIAIERAYSSAEGIAVADATFTHGKSYRVDLKITTKEHMNNVVIADLLPAGLEIENPRLSEDALAGQERTSALTPAYLEIRDDRLVTAFDAIGPGVHHFHYLVRAVTPGAFQHPPVYAECMYDPALRGSSAAGQAQVLPETP